jgi:hypothetical protein
LSVSTIPERAVSAAALKGIHNPLAPKTPKAPIWKDWCKNSLRVFNALKKVLVRDRRWVSMFISSVWVRVYLKTVEGFSLMP